jgi:hypothetical protein
MIRLACPNCSKKLAVDDGSAGTICKCPACNTKFRVPAAAAPEPASVSRAPAKRPAPAAPAPSPRDSTTRGQSQSGRRNPPANGRSDDGADEAEGRAARPRRKAAKAGPTPQWVYVAAAAAGVVLCALAAFAIFFKYVWVPLVVIGLPAALLSRKWRLLGGVGVAYLLTGAGFLLLHNTVLKVPSGKPPKGASAQVVDAHCGGLLKDRDKVEAGAWVSVEKPNEPALIRALRVQIKDAYKAGAEKVWLCNIDKKDLAGLPSPDMVVVLPDEESTREHVLAWYQRAAAGKRAPVAGNKYVYVPWD